MAVDALAFLKELPKNFSQIGSIIPSSQALAKALARPIERATKPVRILEVGPGTGPITRRILKLMGPEDHLLICELNPNFIKQLQLKLAKNKYFIKNRARVSFHLGPVQDLRAFGFEGKFDSVISSLPFSNFTPELVHDILTLYRDLLAPDGSLTFVEYAGIRKISSLLKNSEERERVRGVEEVIQTWKEQWAKFGRVDRDLTLMNIPPAFTLEFNHRVPPADALQRPVEKV